MSGDSVGTGSPTLRRLLGPSARIQDAEDRRAARLLAALQIVHVLAALLGTVAASVFRLHWTEDSLLWGPLGLALLSCTLLILFSYVLVRAGRYRGGLGLYISATALFPMLAPFAGLAPHETGLVATAILPVLIAATFLSRGWVVVVAMVTMGIVVAELSLFPLPATEAMEGFAIALTVLASTGLMLVLRGHQRQIEAMRVGQLRESEAALRASEERLRLLVGTSRDLIVVLEANGKRKDAFGAVEAITGYSLSERGPLSHFEAMHPEDSPRIQREFADLLEHPGQVVRTEWRHLHRDGKYRWLEGLVANRLGQAGVDGIVVNIRDVSDRKAAEEALRRNELRFRTLFETVTDGIFLLARDGQLIEVNDAACRQLGYTREELLGMRMDDVAPPEKREHLHEINRQVAEKGHLIFEASHRRKDGSVYPVEVAASQIDLGGFPAFMGVARDITDRLRSEMEKHRLQEQLQQAAKMESIGRLAGGVAHDFNNMLTVVLGNVDLALRGLQVGTDPQETLEEIRSVTLRAVTVTRQLLAFSRKHVIEARPVDMNDLIERMPQMLARLIGDDIQLRTVAGPGLGIVHVDPGLIEQAIVNLVVNARDAMPTGGTVVIETADVTLDLDYVRMHPLVVPGRHVMLAISDTGQGMSDEIKRHIFEPFFTTKQRGQGTGLGLATAYAAVQQGKGSIEVHSEPGKGTTFKIYLPVVSEPVKVATRPILSDQTKLHKGEETILVAEDDDRVRGLVARLLVDSGYEVLAASNGADALALATECKKPIHLLITDVVMPVMNGRELSERLAEIHKETRTLFTSGYTENIITEHGVIEDGIEFLSKPYTLDALAERVRRVLDRAKEARNS
jgi:two-component system cell cycle sensor histidine kinase/response regulator CckA